jgi:hypothetical protein
MKKVLFDHLVYGTPDLAAGVEKFFAATGVRPVTGGRHLGYGTANYLVGLGEGRYLEFLGIDSDATDSPPRRMFGIEPADTPRLLTWAVRTDDIEATVAAARRGGYDPGAPVQMSRRTVSGDVLQWQLTPDTLDATGGLAPFLIDWGSTTHPTRNELPAASLTSLTLLTPDPGQLGRALTALGVSADVEKADRAGIRAVLATPNGALILT